MYKPLERIEKNNCRGQKHATSETRVNNGNEHVTNSSQTVNEKPSRTETFSECKNRVK